MIRTLKKDIRLTILARLKHSSLLRDTTHLSIGQGLKLVIQASYFVLIARCLGPDAYGAFVAVVAMVAILAPFSGVGTPNLFVRNVRAGKRDAQTCWGNGLVLVALSGSALSILALAAGYALQLKTAAVAVLSVSLSDLVFMKVTELTSFGLAASDRMKDASIQNVVLSLLRLAGIAFLSLSSSRVSLNRWCTVYFFASILGAVYALIQSARLWGIPRIDVALLREDSREGVFFSISTSAATIYNDVDKLMLARLSDLNSTGIYSAAYRVIDVSLTPVRSLVSAAYPKFFSKGAEGMRGTYPYAWSLIAKSAIYGMFLAVGLWIFAPILPIALGQKYYASVPALRWLALIPLLRCFHLFWADSLTGAGFQRARTAIQVGVGLINVGLNFAILPRYSWRGAAWTSLACDGMLAITFWIVAVYCLRKQPALSIGSPKFAET